MSWNFQLTPALIKLPKKKGIFYFLKKERGWYLDDLNANFPAAAGGSSSPGKGWPEGSPDGPDHRPIPIQRLPIRHVDSFSHHLPSKITKPKPPPFLPSPLSSVAAFLRHHHDLSLSLSMEALAGAASSSLLPTFPGHHHHSKPPPSRLALRSRPCRPLRAAAAPGGAKEDAPAGVTPNGSPVLKLKSDSSQNGVLRPSAAEKLHTPLSTHTAADSSGSRAGLFRTPISGGVQSATFTHGLPPPALAVRNLMEQAQFAHLCTVMSGMHHRRAGYPFGSLVDFANDSVGHPIFSLSPLAIHTRNLLSDPRCTLVVQVPGWSGLSNARVTIFGDVYPLPADQQELAHKQYVAKHQQWASQQWGNFYYYRMQNISDIYFIGGFGTVAWVDVKQYEDIQPDKIAVNGGEQSLKELNVIFSKPLREFLSSEGEVDDAALISVDSKGIDIRVRQGAQFNIQRLAFDVPHKVETLEEAKRALHKLIKTSSK